MMHGFKLLLCFAVAPAALSQAVFPSIGSVSTTDANVSNSSGGVVEVSGTRALLRGSTLLTAKDHTAVVALNRGGELRVCRSTGVHLTAAADNSLFVAIDRGALEIHSKARSADVVITPDLRFTFADLAPQGSPLDLQMRVAANGDTCVANRGDKAPTVKIGDAFGEASYQLKPGQHVLFEHGSLREVVDREATPCGCPPDEPAGISLADAAVAGGISHPVTSAQAAATQPFPAAVSEGLAEPSPPPPEAPKQIHVEVASTLAYDPNAPSASSSPVSQNTQLPAPAPATQPAGGPFRAIGRFFKRLFVR